MKIMEYVTKRLDEKFGTGNYYIICVAIGGSRAYGIANEESDYDVTGIFIPPVDYLLGLKELKGGVFELGKNVEDNIEGALFEFGKWLHLVAKQNGNATELLWLEDNQYLFRDEDTWPALLEKREALMIKALKHPLASYAFAQLNRLDKVNEKVNQNKKRLAEFEKFGYSTKNAAHLFRLLGMALDALVEHRHLVMRPDRQFLISIKNGAFSYADIVRMATDKYNLVEQAYIASTLPLRLDMEMVNDLMVKIYKKGLENLI